MPITSDQTQARIMAWARASPRELDQEGEHQQVFGALVAAG